MKILCLMLFLIALALPTHGLAASLPADAEVLAKRLIVRSKAESKSASLGSLNQGSAVSVLATQEGSQPYLWCQIRYKGHNAWVYGEFLSGEWKKSSPSPAAEPSPPALNTATAKPAKPATAGITDTAGALSLTQLAALVEKTYGSIESEAVRLFGPALRQRSEKSPQGRRESLTFSGHTTVYNADKLESITLNMPEANAKARAFGPLFPGAPSSILAPYGEHASQDGQHILCSPEAACFHITVKNSKISALSYSKS